MPRGRVAYKQYSLYCIGLQAVLATAYYTVPYKALLSIPPWAGAAATTREAASIERARADRGLRCTTVPPKRFPKHARQQSGRQRKTTTGATARPSI